MQGTHRGGAKRSSGSAHRDDIRCPAGHRPPTGTHGTHRPEAASAYAPATQRVRHSPTVWYSSSACSGVSHGSHVASLRRPHATRRSPATHSTRLHRTHSAVEPLVSNMRSMPSSGARKATPSCPAVVVVPVSGGGG